MLTNPLSRIQPCATQVLSLEVTLLCNAEHRDNKGVRILLFTPCSLRLTQANKLYSLTALFHYFWL